MPAIQPSLPPLRAPHLTRLPDGRALAWRAWGPPEGRPLIFCTGAATSSALGFGAAAADALGLRVIAIDRPGLGQSSPHPDKTLTSWAGDVATFAHAEALSAPWAIGFSQGGVFALALAAAGVVERVAIVAGQDELSRGDARARLPAAIGALVDEAARGPAGLETKLASWASAESLWQLIDETSGEQDRAVFTASPFAERFRFALEEGFSAGPAGYARDTRLALAPWPFDVARLPGPVNLWYGSLDTSPMHALDHGAALERLIPRARRVVVPDGGSSLLWTHARRILEELSG